MEVAKLVIEFTASGQINVTGPIENKVLCYGMLEAAKDAIRAHVDAQQRIVQPVIVPFPPLPGSNNGK